VGEGVGIASAQKRLAMTVHKNKKNKKYLRIYKYILKYNRRSLGKAKINFVFSLASLDYKKQKLK